MMNVTIEYSPVTLGKLRLVLHVQATMENLKNLGFSDKDVDEVKGIFADTNVYLLGGTFFIAAVHVSTSTDIKVVYYLKNLEFFYKEFFFLFLKVKDFHVILSIFRKFFGKRFLFLNLNSISF